MIKILAASTAALLGTAMSIGIASADPMGASPDDDAKARNGSAAAPADQRRYCVEDTVTGSRIPQRQCKTRAEWMKEGFDPLNP